jgi:hypothetical protein
MQCYVEFGYQLDICSGTAENPDRAGRSQDLPALNTRALLQLTRNMRGQEKVTFSTETYIANHCTSRRIANGHYISITDDASSFLGNYSDNTCLQSESTSPDKQRCTRSPGDCRNKIQQICSFPSCFRLPGRHNKH